MSPELIKRLAKPNHDEKLVSLTEYCVKHANRSRRDMGERHPSWDRNREIYLGVRPMDRDDREAVDRGQPDKFVVPTTYAQVNTFAAFAYLLFHQNRSFYAFDPGGDEDHKARFEAERIIARDLRVNKWPSILYQSLIDFGSLGICVTKEHWVRETVQVPTAVPSATGPLHGIASPGSTSQIVERVKFEGNRIENISPYQWFYDTRRSLPEWHLGEFAGDETCHHKDTLLQWETDRIVSGVRHVPHVTDSELESRKGTRLPDFVDEVKTKGKTKDMIAVTDMYLARLVPSKYDLGPEEFPARFMIWIANDKRIIRIERVGELHQQFPYNVGQFSPDQHAKLCQSIGSAIFDLQGIITWLINSRIISVTRSIDGRAIADPEAIDASSFEQQLSPVIWMQRGMPKVGVDKFFQQLPYQDVTGAHLPDSQYLGQLAREATGINENAMGAFHPGRRSATEARAVNAGASGRMKLHASLMWHDMLCPQGVKLLTNSRQAISFETFSKIIGVTNPNLNEAWAWFQPADRTELVGNEDYFVLDSTLETEKGFIADNLQELVGAILSNPLNAQIFNLDPVSLIEEIMQLRGVGRISRHAITFPPGAAPVDPNSSPAGSVPGQVPGAPPSPQPGVPAVPQQSGVQTIPGSLPPSN